MLATPFHVCKSCRSKLGFSTQVGSSETVSIKAEPRQTLRLRRAPGTWNDLQAQKAEIDAIYKALNLQSKADWYTVRRNKLTQLGANGIVKRHKSVPDMLRALYPEHKWEVWRFQKRNLTERFDDALALKSEVDRIGKVAGVNSLEDWYQVEYRHFSQHGGSFFSFPVVTAAFSELLFSAKGLIRMFEHSPYKLLRQVFPTHRWLPWKFKVAPHGFWPVVKNQREFLEYLLIELKGWTLPRDLDKVYKLKRGEIRDAGGRTLLTYYDHTVARMFSSTFPEYEWQEWKFYWASSLTFWRKQAQAGKIENAKIALESLAHELSVKALGDWYRVGSDALSEFGAAGMIKAFGGLGPLLARAYPVRFIPFCVFICANDAWYFRITFGTRTSLAFRARLLLSASSVLSCQKFSLEFLLRHEPGFLLATEPTAEISSWISTSQS